MHSFRAAAVAAAALIASAACGKTAGVATSAGSSPEPSTSTSASTSTPTAVATGDSRTCPARDASQPDRRPTVAVMYFENAAVSNKVDFAPLSKGIADMFVGALRANCNIRVVEREQLQRLLKEQDIPPDRTDAATRVKIGKLLGAKHMVMGTFVVVGDQMVMTANAMDAETGEHEANVSERNSTKNLLDMVPVLAQKLNNVMRLPPMQQTPAFEGARPPKRDDELLGLRLYSRALEEQDRGNKPKASELYRAALEKFPAYGPAQQALRKLQTGI